MMFEVVRYRMQSVLPLERAMDERYVGRQLLCIYELYETQKYTVCTECSFYLYTFRHMQVY